MYVAGHWRALSQHSVVRRHSRRHDRRRDRDLAVDAAVSIRLHTGLGGSGTAGSRGAGATDSRGRVVCHGGDIRSRKAGRSCSHSNGANSVGRCAKCSRRSIFLSIPSIWIPPIIRRTTGVVKYAMCSRFGRGLRPFRRSSSAASTSGGCTETFDAFNDGRLQELLRKNSVNISSAENVNAYSFLPRWLHPR